MGRRLTCLRIWLRAVFSRSMALLRRIVCFAFFRFEKPVKYSLRGGSQSSTHVFLAIPAVEEGGREGGLTFGRLHRTRLP